MVYDLMLILLVILSLIEISNLVHIICSYSWIKRNRHTLGRRTGRITVFIPVYSEKRIIDSTLEYWRGLCRGIRDLEVVFITTQKEGRQEDSTYFELQNLLRDRPVISIKVLHYPKRRGGKAAQINWATKQLRNLALCAIYDADSRPEKNVFHSALRLWNHNEKVLQQYPCYLSKEIGNENSIVQKGFGLFQTRRTFYYELPNTLLQYYKHYRFVPHYVIGHGLFVDGIFLRTNPLPEETVIEDLEYGYRLDEQSELVYPLPYFDLCTMPKTVYTTFRQSGLWFLAEFQSSLLRLIKRPVNTLQLIRNMVKFIENTWWLCASWVFVWALVLGFSMAINIIYLLVGIVLIVLVQNFLVACICLRYNLFKRSKIENESLITCVFASLIATSRYFANSLGPMIGIVRLIKSYVFGGSVYIKTPR